MSSPILDGTNIDTSVFSYSAPKANPAGGKVVNLYNKHFRESLTITTPIMLTWGAQEGMDQAKNPTGKFTLALQFPSGDFSNPDAENFLKSMRTLEAKVKADAMINSKEWFGKEIKSADVMDEKFNVMLRHPKKEKGGAEMDYNKAPTLIIKIPCWKGVWQTEIYDEEGGTPLFLKSNKNSTVSPLDFLKPKTHLMCLIQCGGLWFVNGKVSITWNLKQAVVQKPKTSAIVEGVCFLKPKPADVQRLKSLPPPENDYIDPEGPIVSTIVEDSDNEEEYELPPPKQVVETVTAQSVVEEPVTTTDDAVAPVETKKKTLKKKKET